MDLLDRLICFTIGAGVGFVLRYIVDRLREIVVMVREVLAIERKKNEQGAVKRLSLSKIELALAMTITVGAAFATGSVNVRLDRTLTCLTQYNSHLGRSLASRDTAVKSGTQSEIELWSKYGRLYAIAKSDPKKIPVVQEQLNKAILDHRNDLIETQRIRQQHPYPNPDILKNCKEN